MEAKSDALDAPREPDSGQGQEPSPAVPWADTAIVFDWDDTLLPTTWLERRRVLHSTTALRPAHIRGLQALAEAANRTLDVAEKLGRVIIVTNAAHGWVEASVQQF